MAPQNINPDNNNVSLHLQFLALCFTSLIYKMLDNCVDTTAIKTCIITPLKDTKIKRFICLKQ